MSIATGGVMPSTLEGAAGAGTGRPYAAQRSPDCWTYDMVYFDCILNVITREEES